MKNRTAAHKLTSKEAARLLGASEASVKRWADGGLLPSEKTAGGHRRFSPADVARFRREHARAGTTGDARRAFVNGSDARAADESREAATRLIESEESLVALLFDALTRGGTEETSALLVNSYLDGRPLAVIFDRLLSPAMRRVGELWHQGELTVAEEHLATRAALRALQTLDDVVVAPEPNDLLAVCCSTEDDFHELPLRCAELTLRHGGWEVLSLGTHTPFYALREMVARLRPALVCVASTMLADLDRAVREYAELRATGARVRAAFVLGGAGVADTDVRRRLPAELHADNFQQLHDFAAALAAARDVGATGDERGNGQAG